ncbi:DUF692 family multinuclear iron-containing protein, partial [Vibrio campbellii]
MPIHDAANSNPEKLIGVGLRHPHMRHFIQEKTNAGWLEIHSENYFEPHSVARQQLRDIAQHYPI